MHFVLVALSCFPAFQAEIMIDEPEITGNRAIFAGTSHIF
jgi:hypothetical protein